MTPNPYESPRPGEPIKERQSGNDPMLQLLVEIRDAQVEMLRITRDAQLRQRKFWAMPLVFMVFPLIIMLFPLYRLYTGVRVPPPSPARRVPAPAAAPAIPPTPPPTTFRATSPSPSPQP